MPKRRVVPHLSPTGDETGLRDLFTTEDGAFRVGENGVVRIVTPNDRKVEFIAFADRTLAHVKSAMGYDAYYPLRSAEVRRPIRAVLMDLDGTSVHSESFWIWIIERTTASLLGDPGFTLEAADEPHVSGHSVSEHLAYCITKYCPDKSVEQAREIYFEHTRRELAAVLRGEGRIDAFAPAPGLKPFLLALKQRGIQIALVTSGLYEKAWPEIVSAFRALELGDPAAFYDAIITAGQALQPGRPGTLGELTPKPHPWLYAEAARVGLGIEPAARHHVVGIEDSGAGICSIRLAGFAAVGLAGGNIETSGCGCLCHTFAADLEQVLAWIDGGESQCFTRPPAL